jgi:hypothetical protein
MLVITPTWSRLAHPKARDWLFGDGTPTKGDVGDANVLKDSTKMHERYSMTLKLTSYFYTPHTNIIYLL